jgi:hypothetical protein
MLGKLGTPYDCYLASDYEKVKVRYKAIIVIDAYRTPLVDGIIADAEQRGVGCHIISAANVHDDPSTIREFCRNCGVHIYTDCDAVVYANESYLFVHSCDDKMPAIAVPEGKKLHSLFESNATKPMHPKFVSALYEIE